MGWTNWEKVSEHEFTDIIYEKKCREEGGNVARISFNRPKILNAFTGHTCKEVREALYDASHDRNVGVVVLTGAGKKAFCTGGDAKEAETGYSSEMLRYNGRVHALIREMPKPAIAAVNGYAIGGGRVLQQLCDLSIASETASLGQAGPKVGSYDAAYGAAYLTRLVGEKKAREIWYLCRRYSAAQALEMGLVNAVVPADKLEEETDKWCDELLERSPGALKALKEGFNAMSAEIRGLETIMFDLLWRYYATPEAVEWKKAFWEKRPPQWQKFRRQEKFPGVYGD
ncbi:MAG: enoyl-CoA hydratase-related protein [bacterium]|nr:enoyl-CoA hydratase-related protein [bacterium]